MRPVRVATGEHVANPVMFKQLLQAGALAAAWAAGIRAFDTAPHIPDAPWLNWKHSYMITKAC